MKKRIITSVFIAIVLLFNSYIVFAEQREITIPIQNGEIGIHPSLIGFTPNGQLGFVLAFSLSNPSKQLFSFSVTKSEMVDSFDLTPEFGFESGPTLQPIFLKLHGESGLALVYGLDASLNQKVVALAFDANGKLSKRWTASYPTADGIWPQVTFNDTGTKIYIAHSKTESVIDSSLILLSTKISVLRAEDGVETGAIFKSEGASTLSITFNQVQKRAIAILDGTVYILTPESEELKIADTIQSTDPIQGLARILGISKDGKFLIAYSGYITNANSNLLTNVYLSYNLNLREIHTLHLSEASYPGGSFLTYHQSTDTLFAPLYISRQADVISMNIDGSLLNTATLTLPKRSAGNINLNTIRENNIAVSATGTLGFLALNNGHLFRFDTLNGEIVGDESIGENSFHFIHLLETPELLVYRIGLNKLGFVNINTGPVITEVKIKKKITIIKGANFLTGVKVKVNGTEVENIERSLENIGGEIILKTGRKNFPEGQDIVITVENRDNLSSKPFIVKL
jgi:hypothetical protein